MKSYIKRAISILILTVTCLFTVADAAPIQYASAASSKYITVDDFIKYLVTEMKLPVDNNSQSPYIDAAMKAGIIKQDDNINFSSYLTRTDCAVFANRADEYLHGAYFGYSKEVYEFLKGCEYYNGFLYYNIKGKLYPEGKTWKTYEASEFLEEVVYPIINPYFSYDGKLRAYYESSKDKMGNDLEDYVMIGLGSDDNMFQINNLGDNNYLVKAWKNIINGDRKVRTVYNKRISDLKKVAKSKRQDIAEIMAKGIIKGYSNGTYIQNRAFRGNYKISTSAAKNVVALVLDPSKRAFISPDGQLIRTTNLPKNAKDYPYILECFPNDFYEMKFKYNFSKKGDGSPLDLDQYYSPARTDETFWNKRYGAYYNLGIKPYEYYDAAITQAYKYLNCVFNVDYRTIDKKWKETVASSYIPFNGDNIYDAINDYIKAMKENHVIVESKVISVEPSTLYYFDNPYIRVYVKYRITADTLQVKNDNELIFGDNCFTYLVGIKNGKWTYGYYDILLSDSNVRDSAYLDFGVHPWVAISDWVYKGDK